MTAKQRLVVVGNGMAGARLVEEVLARGGVDLFDIVVFGDEPVGNYNRILLSGVLAGTHSSEDIFINPIEWYSQNGVKAHAGTRAGWIDRAGKSVHAPRGITEKYDKLVIATGSSPFVPPLGGAYDEEGALRDGVFVFRTLEDCAKITGYADRAKKAAVIGGGLLGLEAARGLLSRGIEVHVVHLMDHLMETQLDPQSGALLSDLLQRMGLHVHLGKATTAILGNGHVTGLAFKDGATLDCDMVVVSAGIRPNVDLAKQAGLTVQRGIVVNDDLSTRNDPDVFAIGECAQHRGQVYGLVAPLWEQARVLADLLTGKDPRASYKGSKVSTKLKVMGVDLAVMGEKAGSQEGDEVVTYVEPSRGIYRKLIVRGSKLVGAILLGDATCAPRLLQAFDRMDDLPPNRAELIFPGAEDSKAFTPADLPDDAQVCDCNGVSKGRIVAAVRAGNRTLKALCAATRAGTGCGACKPRVQALIEHATDGLLAEDPSVHYYVTGVPMTKPELIKAVKARDLRSVSAVFNALSGGEEDPGSKPGLASLLKTIWGKDYVDERDARGINDRVHANIQNDDTFSVVPRIFGGVITPDQLRRIADVAEKYNVPLVKVTGGQRIDLLGISKEDLPRVWQDLGMPSGHAYSKAFRTVKTCVGSDFCRFGVGDSTKLGIEIEQRFQGIETPHKVKMAVSGCRRNCAEASTKDVGVIALEGGKWEVLVGGAAGASVRKGDVLCVVGSHQDVVKHTGRFLQYYRENARYMERSYDFVARLGIEKLRAVLVEDTEGIAANLDAAMEASVEAYEDPWNEAGQPVHPNQFGSLVGSGK